jgi:DNA-binding SARP family transcriptional activator
MATLERGSERRRRRLVRASRAERATSGRRGKLAPGQSVGSDTAGLASALTGLTQSIDARLRSLEARIAELGYGLTVAPPPFLPLTPATDPAATQVTFLGPFRLTVGGQPVESWTSGKSRALLQYLLSHRGRALASDTLISALWPDAAAVAPGTSLKVAVHGLRRTFEQIPATKDTVVVQVRDGTYQVCAPTLWVDVEEFGRSYELGRLAETKGDEATALTMYARAAALYRGDFLEELTDEWPKFRREALKDQYLFLLFRLASAAVSSGDYQEGIVRCGQLLARDGCREDAYRLLMICHARLGQRGRVRSWYELCARTLRAELDCGPDEETERVYRLALAGKA